MQTIPLRFLVLATFVVGCSSGGGGGGGGTGGVNPGTGGSTPGTGGAGGTGPGGSGGSMPGTGGAGGATASCGWKPGYKGPLLGRCSPMSCTDGKCGTAVARGGFLTLDDFEGTPTSAFPIGIHWPARDSRTGAWTQYASPQNQLQVAATDTNGGSLGSKQALHYSGGTGTFEPTLGLPMGSSCYDASAYEGVSFWIKGNPAAGNTRIKFNVHTPVTEPVASGGACTGGCYDHFAKLIDITPTWTRYRIRWTDLGQVACTKPTPPIPDGFEPHKQILAFSFSITDKTKGFDFWLDDFTFDVATTEANTFPTIVTEALFNEMFPAPKAPYSYQGLLAAATKYGSKWGPFVGDRSPIDRKHEAAAFLAHVAHETSSLMLAEETCKCTMPPYYGRGALQLTGQFNYQQAQNAGFDGIVANPQLVATNPDFAFGTAIWFWMTPQSAQGITHSAILEGDFGRTTRIINGIECGSDPNSKQLSRVQLYKDFAAALGINPRGNLLCN
jgi:basic endochitinase B